MANPQVPAPLIAPNWWIGILPRKYWRRKKVVAAYEADFLPVPTGAVQGVSQTTPIQNDSDFLWLQFSALITTTANPPVIVWGGAMLNNVVTNLLIDVTQAGSNLDLFQSPVPLDNLAGSGPYPAPVVFPHLFPRADAIRTTLFAVSSGVTSVNVRCTYWGLRIYDIVED
jgi:hypothetical protein